MVVKKVKRPIRPAIKEVIYVVSCHYDIDDACTYTRNVITNWINYHRTRMFRVFLDSKCFCANLHENFNFPEYDLPVPLMNFHFPQDCIPDVPTKSAHETHNSMVIISCYLWKVGFFEWLENIYIKNHNKIG